MPSTYDQGGGRPRGQGGNSGKGGHRFQDRPGYGKDRPAFGDKRGSGPRPGFDRDRPAFGDKRGSGPRPGFDKDRPAFGDKRGNGSRPGFDRDRPAFGDKRGNGPRPGFDQERPAFGDKRGNGPRPDYDKDRPAFGDKRGSGPRPGFDKDRPAFGDKRGNGPRPGFDKDRPAFGDKRGSGPRPGFDRDRPAFGDKRGRGPRPGFDKDRPAFEGKRERDPRPGFDQERPRFAPIAPTPTMPIFDGEEALPRENLLKGRNPIREAIKSGRDIEKLLVAKGELSGSAREILAMAREQHIVVQVVDRARLDEITDSHQGMLAFASAFRYAQVEDMFALAASKGEDPLLVLLDGVTDPHNLGAIIRSAECAGAHGVIVPERRAVGLTPAAVKASAGAVEYLPVARVGNVPRFLDSLKEKGLWIAAADIGGRPYTGADLTGPLCIVVGAEGSGISRLVLERCDHRLALPIRGKIDSLNASVAAGVLLYEIRRQRG